MPTLTLFPDRVASGDIMDFYDGEHLDIQIERGLGIDGTLTVTIDERKQGGSTGVEALLQFSVDGDDSIFEPPSALNALAEDRPYFFFVWEWTGTQWIVRHEGQIRKRPAIRPDGTVIPPAPVVYQGGTWDSDYTDAVILDGGTWNSDYADAIIIEGAA